MCLRTLLLPYAAAVYGLLHASSISLKSGVLEKHTRWPSRCYSWSQKLSLAPSSGYISQLTDEKNHSGLKNDMCKFIYSMYYYVVYDSAVHYKGLKNDV